jgi:hypothetical protein
MTNVSTNQKDPAFMPYMLGFGFYQDAFFESRSSFAAEYVVMNGPTAKTRSITRTKIAL